MPRNGRNSCLVQPAPGWIPEIWRCPEEDLSYPDTLLYWDLGKKNETSGQLYSLVSAWNFFPSSTGPSSKTNHQASERRKTPPTRSDCLKFEMPKNWVSVVSANTGKKRPLIVQIIWQVLVVHWWALQSFAHIEPHILHKPITKELCPFKNYVSHLMIFLDLMMFDYTFRFPKENDLNLWFMMLVNALSFHWSPRDL